MVDLKAKPYYLNTNDIEWIEKTIAGMTVEEKIGQLFINLFFDLSPDACRAIIEKYHIGGARYINASGEKVLEFTKDIQQSSKIPLLIAANCEAGGNGACKDGTFVATAAQVGATGNEQVAYNKGLVSGRESAAIGVNWIFAPIDRKSVV